MRIRNQLIFPVLKNNRSRMPNRNKAEESSEGDESHSEAEA